MPFPNSPKCRHGAAHDYAIAVRLAKRLRALGADAHACDNRGIGGTRMDAVNMYADGMPVAVYRMSAFIPNIPGLFAQRGCNDIRELLRRIAAHNLKRYI
jgi:protein gp37